MAAAAPTHSGVPSSTHEEFQNARIVYSDRECSAPGAAAVAAATHAHAHDDINDMHVEVESALLRTRRMSDSVDGSAAEELARASSSESPHKKRPRRTSAQDLAQGNDCAPGQPAAATRFTGATIQEGPTESHPPLALNARSMADAHRLYKWECNFLLLRRWVQKHGHSRVVRSLDTKQFPKLGAWVHRQRAVSACVQRVKSTTVSLCSVDRCVPRTYAILHSTVEPSSVVSVAMLCRRIDTKSSVLQAFVPKEHFELIEARSLSWRASTLNGNFPLTLLNLPAKIMGTLEREITRTPFLETALTPVAQLCRGPSPRRPTEPCMKAVAASTAPRLPLRSLMYVRDQYRPLCWRSSACKQCNACAIDAESRPDSDHPSPAVHDTSQRC